MNIKDIYRKIFVADGKKTSKNDIKANFENVESVCNLRYGEDLVNNLFDVHFPKDNQKKLPTIFVVHGGGYVSGQKEDNNRLCKMLSENGFCVVNFEYTKVYGKENKFFPTPIYEFFEMFEKLQKDEKLSKHIDFDNIFLAGDSAGSHIVSLVANIQTNDNLKLDFDLTGGPKVKGLILTCPVFGQYKFAGLPPKKQYHELIYGKNNELSKICHNFDVLTDKFPPSIMFSAPNDFVSRTHVKMFLKKAKELGLSVKFCDIKKGYKLFHESMLKFTEYYPNYSKEMCKFVDDAVKNKFVMGVDKIEIKEPSKKEIDQKLIDSKNECCL